MVDRIEKTDEQWRQELSDDRYTVLRRAGTEPPFSGTLVDTEDPGLYRCGACRAELFRSDTKYHSGSGWPSFWAPVSEEAVELVPDHSHGMSRTEVRCARCGSHLGHLFPDGPQPTGLRYCMNSLALDFTPENGAAEQPAGG